MEREERAEQVERAAYEDLFRAGAAPELRASIGMSAQEVGPALVLRSLSLPSILFNRAIGLDADADAAMPLVDSVVARFRAQRIEDYLVHLRDRPGADALRARLRQLGLAPRPHGWSTLGHRGREFPHATGSHEVVRAHLSDARELAALIAEGYGLPDPARGLLMALVGRPGWHVYTARSGGKAEAGLAMFVRHRCAHIAFVTTAVEARGRGAVVALLGRALLVARELGVDFIGVESAAPLTTPVREDGFTRLGFEKIATRENWAPVVAPAPAGVRGP